MSLTNLFSKLKGGAGSGNIGHAGRIGHRGGSAPKGNLTQAFLDYTNLTGFSSVNLKKYLDSKEMKDLATYTQQKLKEEGYSQLRVTHKTQNLYEDLQTGDELELGDVTSWSMGQGPQEYKDYRYEVIVNLPFNKVLAASKVSPELFPIKSEDEVISRKTKLKVNSVFKDTDDRGRIINPIRVFAEVIG